MKGLGVDDGMGGVPFGDPPSLQFDPLGLMLFDQRSDLRQPVGIEDRFVVSIPFERRFLASQGLDGPFEVFQAGRLGGQQHLHPRGGRVEKIDRLVGELSSGDVARGQLGGRFGGVVSHHDFVDLFVFVFQPPHDKRGDFDRRFRQTDELEPAGQRRVPLEIFLILGPGGGGDGPQFAPRQRRLQQVRRVRSTGGPTGADEGVGFVDEKDNRFARRFDLVDDAPQSFLELSFDRSPRFQKPHVEPQNRDPLEQVGDVSFGDSQSKPFDHGGFTDAGVADTDRVVLSTTGEDVDHLADLFVPSEDRVDISVGRFLVKSSQKRAMAEPAAPGAPLAAPPGAPGAKAPSPLSATERSSEVSATFPNSAISRSFGISRRRSTYDPVA